MEIPCCQIALPKAIWSPWAAVKEIMQDLPDVLENVLRSNWYQSNQDIWSQVNKAKSAAFTISQIENGRGFNSQNPLLNQTTEDLILRLFSLPLY